MELLEVLWGIRDELRAGNVQQQWITQELELQNDLAGVSTFMQGNILSCGLGGALLSGS